jgi:glycosyltransferase involved in cell wall biosynthesis
MTDLMVVFPCLALGGAELQTLDLLVELRRQGIDSVVATLSDDNPVEDRYRTAGIDVRILPRRKKLDGSLVARTRRAIQEIKPAAVLCEDLFTCLVVERALRASRGGPLVAWVVHGIHEEGMRGIKHRAAARLISRDRPLIVVCDWLKGELARLYGIPPRRCLTVHNGVNLDEFAPAESSLQAEAARDSLGLPADAFVVVQVASLLPYKRHDVLIEAVALANRSDHARRKTYALCVGGGTAERLAELKRHARARGVADEVVFAGARSDVRPYLSCADLFCLVSDVEAFPVSCLEALAVGLPAVVTDVGGLRELVQPGVNGVVVPPGDPEAVATAWECIPVDSNARERARQSIVGRFDIRQSAAQYVRALSLSSPVSNPLQQPRESSR